MVGNVSRNRIYVDLTDYEDSDERQDAVHVCCNCSIENCDSPDLDWQQEGYDEFGFCDICGEEDE